MEFYSQLVERIRLSREEAIQDLNKRKENGLQPYFPLVDWDFIVPANIFYFVFVCVLMLFMKKRSQGFYLKPVITIYNATCVLLAGYVLVELFRYKVIEGQGSFICNTLDLTPRGKHIGFVFWVFYIQKYWEFMDTFFFILRKSFRQVTFLHLFHHASITVVVGANFIYDFNGDMFWPILLNSFVHVLMYSHYLATAMGIHSWWRKYLTSLQLVQFVGITFANALAYYRGPSCGYDFLNIVMIAYMASMLVLFGNFFFQRYVLNKEDASLKGVIKSEVPEKKLLIEAMADYISTHGEAALAPLINEAKNLSSSEQKSDANQRPPHSQKTD